MAPKGVDVVFDTVGGKHFEESMKCVKWGAQILIIGFASGTIPKVKLTHIYASSPKEECENDQPI